VSKLYRQMMKLQYSWIKHLKYSYVKLNWTLIYYIVSITLEHVEALELLQSEAKALEYEETISFVEEQE
jgi:hypothetical protein